MATIADMRQWAKGCLEEADGIARCLGNVMCDINALMQHALGKTLAQMLAHSNYELTPAEEDLFRACVKRRAAFEPVAYIVGQKEFYGYPFQVDRRVLIPRPETELLVEVALSHFDPVPDSFFVCDIGVGSGAIILALMNRLSEIHGKDYLARGRFVATDVSAPALDVCMQNAQRLGLGTDLELLNTSVISGLSFDKKYSLCIFVSNPPYVIEGERLAPDVFDFEPHGALFGGRDGLEVIRQLLEQTEPYVVSGAKLIFEFGFGQAEAVSNLVCATFGNKPKLMEDLAGIKRVCVIG